jgi:predicted nucleic acid-binding protein
MAIVLDADVIIRGEKGLFDLKRWLTKRADESFEVASITISELWHGVERATPRQRGVRERYLRGIVSVLPVLPFTEQTAYFHARLWAQLEAAGTMIGYYDLIVAATALERGSDVASFNKRHFNCVPGLTVIVPE